MANERYKLMCASKHAIKLGLKPCAIAAIGMMGRGKTDTKRIFLANNRDCNEITPTSDTGLAQLLLQVATCPVLIIDDPSDWEKNDFISAIRYSKKLFGGEITTPRATKFNADTVATPATISTFWFWHKGQHNMIEPLLSITGYKDRLVTVWSMHLPETYHYIQDFYEDNHINTNDINHMPIFDLDDFELLPVARKLTQDEKDWIQIEYGAFESQQSIKSIAKAVSEKTFESLKGILQSKSDKRMYYEDIKFKEVK